MSPARALALQRSAGNRATGLMLARQAVSTGATQSPKSGLSETTQVTLRLGKRELKFEALSFYWPLAVNQNWRYGIEITKYVDGNSPILWEWDARKDDYFSTGGPADGVATFEWNGRKQTVTITDAHITSHRINPPKGPGERPTETFTLNAAQEGLPFKAPYERPRKAR